jgi:hypothetical protein
MRGVMLFAIGLALCSPPRARAEEAILRDGRRQQGTLALTDDRLRFTPTGEQERLSFDEVHAIRFPIGPAPPLLAGMAHRVALPGGQQVTGELLGLDDERLRLRTAWAEEVAIPRAAVLSVRQLPGVITFFADEFTDGLKRWKLTGTPHLDELRSPSGGRCLVLGEPDQAAEFTLEQPLEAGSFGITFREAGPVSGAQWLVEADFQEPKPRTVRATVAGSGDGYAAEVPGGKGTATHLAATPGWHRLRMEFAASALVVSVDDIPLWYARQQGPGGPLRRVRLRCAGTAGATEHRGAVAFADFSLARGVDELPRPPGDAWQDEVWLLTADQLFGRVARADRHGVEVGGRFGKRPLPWGEVRGLFLRRGAPTPQTTDGEQVRIRLLPGAGEERDELEGVLQALDDSGLTVHHPILGLCKIDRGRLRELRRLFHGKRIEVDNGVHHLGEANALDPALQPPRAEGTTLKGAFRLDPVPEAARLVVEVVRLQGPGDGIGRALEKGELQTEVLVNGQRVDYLNRHVDRVSAEPRRVELDLPQGTLRAGDNTLELRLTPERVTQRFPHCGVTGIVLEAPR